VRHRVHFDGADQVTWRRARHNPEVSILADRGELIEILASFEHQWQHKSNWLTHLDAQPDAHIASPRILIVSKLSWPNVSWMTAAGALFMAAWVP